MCIYNKLIKICPNEEIVLSHIVVRVIQGKHVKFKVSDLLKATFSKRHLLHPLRKLKLCVDYCKYPEHKETLFYEIVLENKRIQIMGSADLHDDIDYPTGADVLILPHQGRSDMDEHNKKIVERLMPKRVLLDHYDDAFVPFSSEIDVTAFCGEMSKTIPTQKLIEGESIDL